MKRLILIIAAALVFSASGSAGDRNPDYDTYFTPDRLRVDFILAGDAYGQQAYLAGLQERMRMGRIPCIPD